MASGRVGLSPGAFPTRSEVDGRGCGTHGGGLGLPAEGCRLIFPRGPGRHRTQHLPLELELLGPVLPADLRAAVRGLVCPTAPGVALSRRRRWWFHGFDPTRPIRDPAFVERETAGWQRAGRWAHAMPGKSARNLRCVWLSCNGVGLAHRDHTRAMPTRCGWRPQRSFRPWAAE